MKKKAKILLVGPVPPLIGGISTYISNILSSNLSDEYDFISFATNRPLNNGEVSSQNYSIIYKVSISYLLKSGMATISHLLLFPMTVIKKKPDIIHIHTPSYWSFLENSIYVMIAKLFHKKVILHIHGGGFDKFYTDSSKLMKLYIKSILKFSDHIASISTYWKQFFVNYIGINDNSISVVYNGYDSSLFFPLDMQECRKYLNLPLNKVIIVSVGNLLEEKGYVYLVEAMSKVRFIREDVLCFIIGGGKLEAQLNEMIRSLGLDNTIILLGAMSHDEVPFWMNAANLFVLPSLIEGNPIVMSEALSVGLPFIGSKVGAIPEVIISDSYGFLAEPKNSEDLAEKIIFGIERKWNRMEIIEYSQKFSWDVVSMKLLSIYKSFQNN